MSTGGWIFMLFSVGLVVSLITFCFWRVLTKPQAANHMQSPLDIDTGDLDE